MMIIIIGTGSSIGKQYDRSSASDEIRLVLSQIASESLDIENSA